MSFWNRNKLPAEYKDLSEDQIAGLLAKGKTAEAEAAQLKTENEAAKNKATTLETQANAGRDAVERLKKLREAGLVDDSGNPVSRSSSDDQNSGPSGPPDAATWLTDPNTAFNAAVAPTAAVALHGAIMSARLLADQFIRQQGPVNARLWNKYGSEVAALVDKLPPDQRILPQTWINQFTFVKGMHLDEVVKEGQKEGDAFFSETAGSTGRGLPDNSQTDNDTLTDAEKKVAQRMGRTPEQYLAMKKKMQFGPALN